MAVPPGSLDSLKTVLKIDEPRAVSGVRLRKSPFDLREIYTSGLGLRLKLPSHRQRLDTGTAVTGTNRQ